MDNHPIPQDITGFQFKLIGDMTVKQFAYLAGGAILGWIMYALPVHFLIRYPLAFFCGGMGIALAFVPVEGRPLDVMLIHFIRALATPNQFIYRKLGRHIPLFDLHPAKQPTHTVVDTQSAQKLHTLLTQMHYQQKTKLDEKEATHLASLFSGGALPNFSLPTMPHLTTPQAVPQPQPEQELEEKTQNAESELEKEAKALQAELAKAKAQEMTQQQTHTPVAEDAHQKVLALEKQLSDILSQKQQLEQQLLELAKKLNKPQNVLTPTIAEEKKETSHVKQIPKSMSAQVGLPITPDFPNLIIGIVKDSRGNVLPGILVEVTDQEGNPVRAFKTNTLGQFAAATQVPDGTYTLTFEDPNGKHKFDTVALQAKGEIMLPLEVTSTDAREELRRELFGT